MMNDARTRSTGRMILVIPLVLTTLSACVSTRIVQLPDSPGEAGRVIDAEGPATELTIHALETALTGDPEEVRQTIARADLDLLLERTTPYRSELDYPSFEDFLDATGLDWSDVVVVSHRKTSHGIGALKGLGYGALGGGIFGVALGAMAGGEESFAGTGGVMLLGGLAFGAVGGVFGALFGGAAGSTKKVYWRR